MTRLYGDVLVDKAKILGERIHFSLVAQPNEWIAIENPWGSNFAAMQVAPPQPKNNPLLID